MNTVTIPARFNGPPASGHGGYTCGLVAGLLDVPARVELRAPPPLETAMDVFETDDGVEVRAGDTLVARARPAPPPDLAPPTTVDLDRAHAAVSGYVGFVDHPFPTCFACGPDRAPGDGLRIFPGPVTGTGVVASPWTPGASLDGADGQVPAVHVWTALDCPSAFGIRSEVTAVLASMRIRQDAAIPIADEVVVLGWEHGIDGRKLYGASAIVDTEGEVLAVADALWIAVR